MKRKKLHTGTFHCPSCFIEFDLVAEESLRCDQCQAHWPRGSSTTSGMTRMEEMTQTWRTTNRVTAWPGEMAAGASVLIRRTESLTRSLRAIALAGETEPGPEPHPLAYRPTDGLESPQPEEVWLDLLAEIIVHDLLREGLI